MALAGFFYTLLIFSACFAAICIIKLARMGMEDNTPPKREEKNEPTPPKAQPVYYIVEKKRTKRSYSQPREISFTDESRR